MKETIQVLRLSDLRNQSISDVDIVCEQYRIHQVDSLYNLIQTLIRTYEDGN